MWVKKCCPVINVFGTNPGVFAVVGERVDMSAMSAPASVSVAVL